MYSKMHIPYSNLAHLFLEVRTQIKLYHWQTRVYARHKATDRFIETFEPLVDRFVEAAQGVAGSERIGDFDELSQEQQESIECFNLTPTDDTATEFLTRFRDYMESLDLCHSELAQIRDEMLEIADITLYLFTLR